MTTDNLPTVSERVRELHARMTLDEKLAQIVGYWVDKGDDNVAPLDGEMTTGQSYEDATAQGIGHLTRVYGTRPGCGRSSAGCASRPGSASRRWCTRSA